MSGVGQNVVTEDRNLGRLGDGVWLLDHPACPRCGLTLHRDDPMVGYHPEGGRCGSMKLRHAHSTVTDRDGCIVGLGRAVRAIALEVGL
jgi:ribosomal protein S27AE